MLISKWLPVLTSLCDVRAGGPLKHPTIPGAQPATLRSGATFGWFWWKYYGQRAPTKSQLTAKWGFCSKNIYIFWRGRRIQTTIPSSSIRVLFKGNASTTTCALKTSCWLVQSGKHVDRGIKQNTFVRGIQAWPYRTAENTFLHSLRAGNWWLKPAKPIPKSISQSGSSSQVWLNKRHMGVSINGDTPTWMVYNGNSQTKMDDHWGTPMIQETS